MNTNKINRDQSAVQERCLYCGSREFDIICDAPEIRLCLSCGQGFRAERPENIGRSYFGRVRMPSFFDARMLANHHYQFINDNIGFWKIKSLLEIGSGDGTLLKLIRKRHQRLDLFSVEPSVELCDQLRRIPRVTVINACLEEAWPGRKFDLVVMSHVLEHLEDPVRAIKFVHDNLIEDGGYLYIDIPNRDFELSSPKMASMAPLTHLYFFNGANIRSMLASSGFPKEHIRGSKYGTIPRRYRRNMEIISVLKNSNRPFDKIKLISTKIRNRGSLLLSASFRVMMNIRPNEIALDRTDSNYNNIAIIARR